MGKGTIGLVILLGLALVGYVVLNGIQQGQGGGRIDPADPSELRHFRPS